MGLQALTAGLSAGSSYYAWRAATAERVTVVAKDCQFAQPIILDRALAPVMSRADKQQIARHNLAFEAVCRPAPVSGEPASETAPAR